MMTRFFRALAAVALMLFLSGLTPTGLSSAPARAQEPNAGPSTGDQPATAPPQAGAPASAVQLASDAAAARVKYLHDRLRITPEQEALWAKVAEAIGDNARDAAPLLKERFRSTTSGSALDVLHVYEMLGKVQLDSFDKFIAAFDPLYASLSPGQKKIADAILRQGPVNTMVAGIPESIAPLGLPLAYPFLIGPEVPLVLHRPGHFEHLRGQVSPGRRPIAGGRFGGFHR